MFYRGYNLYLENGILTVQHAMSGIVNLQKPVSSMEEAYLVVDNHINDSKIAAFVYEDWLRKNLTNKQYREYEHSRYTTRY
jgi:hypothetical protein